MEIQEYTSLQRKWCDLINSGSVSKKNIGKIRFRSNGLHRPILSCFPNSCAVERPLGRRHNWSTLALHSFTVTKTFPYLSERFFLLQLCARQQQTAVNTQIEGTCRFVTMIFVFTKLWTDMCTLLNKQFAI